MAELRGSAAPPQRSPWHSPVPYLFGGLAAMLGLIAFALLILACSYWKLSGRSDGEDLEAGAAEKAEPPPPPAAEMEEKFLVIMAGQDRPTFLATPMWSRASSFRSKSSWSSGDSTTSFGGGCEENSGEIGERMGNMGAPGSGAVDQAH
ncbi:Protein GLUTAMINE DUMPER 3 [Striga hermonthica]|uniref:Protein GLUTAMINE DUMPER 3 n=1 Tax=Striga hermonthica TaxID=68872 RepID=A0A9N7NSW4_STRHE|nr:Protein GLUTAMINE DUMPER 3 [Striga hermonthica]